MRTTGQNRITMILITSLVLTLTMSACAGAFDGESLPPYYTVETAPQQLQPAPGMTTAYDIYMLVEPNLDAPGWVNVMIVSEENAQIEDLTPYSQDLSTRQMCIILEDETERELAGDLFAGVPDPDRWGQNNHENQVSANSITKGKNMDIREYLNGRERCRPTPKN